MKNNNINNINNYFKANTNNPPANSNTAHIPNATQANPNAAQVNLNAAPAHIPAIPLIPNGSNYKVRILPSLEQKKRKSNSQLKALNIHDTIVTAVDGITITFREELTTLEAYPTFKNKPDIFKIDAFYANELFYKNIHWMAPKDKAKAAEQDGNESDHEMKENDKKDENEPNDDRTYTKHNKELCAIIKNNKETLRRNRRRNAAPEQVINKEEKKGEKLSFKDRELQRIMLKKRTGSLIDYEILKDGNRKIFWDQRLDDINLDELCKLIEEEQERFHEEFGHYYGRCDIDKPYIQAYTPVARFQKLLGGRYQDLGAALEIVFKVAPNTHPLWDLTLYELNTESAMINDKSVLIIQPDDDTISADILAANKWNYNDKIKWNYNEFEIERISSELNWGRTQLVMPNVPQEIVMKGIFQRILNSENVKALQSTAMTYLLVQLMINGYDPTQIKIKPLLRQLIHPEHIKTTQQRETDKLYKQIEKLEMKVKNRRNDQYTITKIIAQKKYEFKMRMNKIDEVYEYTMKLIDALELKKCDVTPQSLLNIRKWAQKAAIQLSKNSGGKLDEQEIFEKNKWNEIESTFIRDYPFQIIQKPIKTDIIHQNNNVSFTLLVTDGANPYLFTGEEELEMPTMNIWINGAKKFMVLYKDDIIKRIITKLKRCVCGKVLPNHTKCKEAAIYCKNEKNKINQLWKNGKISAKERERRIQNIMETKCIKCVAWGHIIKGCKSGKEIKNCISCLEMSHIRTLDPTICQDTENVTKIIEAIIHIEELFIDIDWKKMDPRKLRFTDLDMIKSEESVKDLYKEIEKMNNYKPRKKMKTNQNESNKNKNNNNNNNNKISQITSIKNLNVMKELAENDLDFNDFETIQTNPNQKDDQIMKNNQSNMPQTTTTKKNNNQNQYLDEKLMNECQKYSNENNQKFITQYGQTYKKKQNIPNNPNNNNNNNNKYNRKFTFEDSDSNEINPFMNASNTPLPTEMKLIPTTQKQKNTEIEKKILKNAEILKKRNKLPFSSKPRTQSIKNKIISRQKKKNNKNNQKQPK